jgi:dihydrofolate reductase
MRPVINSTFVSLDGVINHMEAWHFDYVEQAPTLALEQLNASDAMLMGRKTYDIYAAAWPTRHDEYSDRINAIAKYVVSGTLQAPEWNNTTVLAGDLVDEVRALKATDGRAILMHGFGPVAKTLLREGLLDELHLWYHPVLAGVGEGEDLLFEPGLNVHLDYAGARELETGVVVLSYRAKTP